MNLFCTILIAAVLNICCGDFVLRIAHTNDVHARFEEINKYGGSCSSAEGDECFGGVARRYALLQKLKQQAGPNLLLLDAGDQFQGSLWFNYYKKCNIVLHEQSSV